MSSSSTPPVHRTNRHHGSRTVVGRERSDPARHGAPASAPRRSQTTVLAVSMLVKWIRSFDSPGRRLPTDHPDLAGLARVRRQLCSWTSDTLDSTVTVARLTPKSRPVRQRCSPDRKSSTRRRSWLGGSFGRLPRRRPRAGHGHASAGPGPDEVGLKLGDHGQRIEQQSARRVLGVVQALADAESHAAVGEASHDVSGIRDTAGQAVELGYHQLIAGRLAAASACCSPGRFRLVPV